MLLNMTDDLLAVAFSEFDTVKGPTLICQVPEDLLSSDFFSSIQSYIISNNPRPEGQILTLITEFGQIIGSPVCIRSDSKYKRNEYMFNLFFVLSTSANCIAYECVINKLAIQFRALEIESQFLSNKKNLETLQNYCLQIYQDLRRFGTCELKLENSNFLFLKIMHPPPHVVPNQLLDHEVPVRLTAPDGYSLKQFKFPQSLSNYQDIDMACRRILPFCDGFAHIARIARESDIDGNIVKSSLQNLMHYGMLKVIPIFQYSNEYILTSDAMQRLCTDNELQDLCVKYVVKGNSLIDNDGKSNFSPMIPSFGRRCQFTNKFDLKKKIFIYNIRRIFSGIKPGATMSDIVTSCADYFKDIDEKRLIQFGLIYNLIKRRHKYAIKLDFQLQDYYPEIVQKLLDPVYILLDGTRSLDEICCRFGLNLKQLENSLIMQHNIVTITK